MQLKFSKYASRSIEAQNIDCILKYGMSDNNDDEEADSDEENPHVLLDRFFEFIRPDKKDLNIVLAGYFCQFVTILLKYKLKELVPYIFKERPSILENMMMHLANHSVAEVLGKLVT